MLPIESKQFFPLPAVALEKADVLILPTPIEKTVSYGTGAAGGPQAILNASLQVDTFDEETLVDFATAPCLHVLPPVSHDGNLEECLQRIQEQVRPFRDRFVLALGGEHSITYGLLMGRVDNPSEVTVVQIDAHPDMADQLNGLRWSHGTVMRRLWECGCNVVQIGIRSLTRAEYEIIGRGPRIKTFYAHQLHHQWAEVLAALRNIKGKVYLTIDVDGLDPSIIPSTGTPQPDGLSWRQMMDVLRVLLTESQSELISADVVEFVPSPVAPGCDPIAARLVTKTLAWWWTGKYRRR
jgi:agmatinase